MTWLSLLRFFRIQTICIFALSLILTCAPTLPAVWAIESPTAAITVDGQRLFEVSQLEGFDAQPRADYANQILKQAVESGEPIQVEVVQVNGLPVVQVNRANLLTITPKDTPVGMTQDNQAQRWRDRIDAAIKQAQLQRHPGYIRWALLRSAGCVLLAIAFSWGVNWIGQKLQQFISQRAKIADNGTPTQSLELVLKIISIVLSALICLGAAIYISNQFSQTRVWSQKIIDVVGFSFISPIVPLGNKSYSVVQIIILIGLFAGITIVAKTTRQLLRSRVLRLTGMTRGAQETIALIANYTLIFIGTIILLQLWGLDLSSLTIFASVLGVGIGLGLQGIAKEFVSGLVIIFERPIQVGDFVNVGEYMGTVERISVRSTEIRTLDLVSIIIPNSRFLEEEVVNWNHSSLITRIKLPITVAYGSNLNQVKEELIEAVKTHGDVISDPAPNVICTGYGDNAIKLEVLVWIAEPRKQFLIRSDLYFMMEGILRDRQIEVPFPQRDLHLRSGSIPLELSPQLEASLKNWLNQRNHQENGDP